MAGDGSGGAIVSNPAADLADRGRSCDVPLLSKLGPRAESSRCPCVYKRDLAVVGLNAALIIDEVRSVLAECGLYLLVRGVGGNPRIVTRPAGGHGNIILALLGLGTVVFMGLFSGLSVSMPSISAKVMVPVFETSRILNA